MTDKRIRIILDSKEAQKNAQQLDRDITDVGRSSDSAQFKVKALAAAIAGAFATRQVLDFFVNSTKAAAQFESAVSDLSAITGATGEDLKFLANAAREFGATTTLSATQAAEAIKLIASAKPDLLGNAQALKAVTKEAIALAEAAGIDLPQAASTLGSSLNQFSLDASESSRVINVLAAGAKFGASEIADTAEALKNAGVSAASANVSFESTNAAIQVLSASAIKGAEAGTGLRNIITILDTSADKKLRPSIVGLSQAFTNLDAKQLDATEMVKLFGRENINTARILLNNVDQLKNLEKQLTNTSTAYDQQRIKTDNLKGDLKGLSSAYEELQISVGEMFTGKAREATQELTDATRFLAENLDSVINIVEVLSVAVGTRLAVAIAASAVSFVASIKSEAAAINEANAAAARATVSVNKYTGAITQSAIAAKQATVATQLLGRAATVASGSMALLGGPVGVVLIAATSLLTYASNAKESANATDVLAVSIDGLTKAQAENLNIKTKDALENERQTIAKLKAEIESLTTTYENYATRGGQASRNNAKDQARVADQIDRTRVALGVAEENAGKLEQRLLNISDVIKGSPFDFDIGDPFATTAVTSKSGGKTQTKESSGNLEQDNRAIISAKETTASLQRELDLRRQVSDIYRQAELQSINNQYSLERAMSEAKQQEDLAILESRYAEKVAREQEQFNQQIATIIDNETLKDELRSQFDQQQLINKQILEEEKSAIEQDGANARVRIAKLEYESKRDAVMSIGGSIMQIAQGQNKKAFEIGKKAAIASAAIDGVRSAISAWRSGMETSGPWAPVVAAGYTLASVAKTSSLIGQIKSQSYNGGGSNPSIGGGGISPIASSGAPTASTVSNDAQQAQAPRQSTTIVLESDSWYRGGSIVERLKEEVENGSDVSFMSR